MIEPSRINTIKAGVDLVAYIGQATGAAFKKNGKGKERVVPVSQAICEMVRNYIMVVRPAFLNGNDLGYLILNRWGGNMDPNGAWAVVKRCAHLAGIKWLLQDISAPGTGQVPGPDTPACGQNVPGYKCHGDIIQWL